MDSRRVGIDILKIVGMILILLGHFPGYFNLPILREIETYLVTLGLSIFVFVSGFSLSLNYNHIEKVVEVWMFCKKRLLRIYPLYLTALGIFILMFYVLHIYHNPKSDSIFLMTTVHFFGLQVFFEPLIPSMFTLWYIGLIILYYIVFIVIAITGGDCRRTFLIALGLFAFFFCLRIFLNLIGDRFFMYYPLFVLGIIVNKSLILKSKTMQTWFVGLILGASAITSIFFLWIPRHVVYSRVGLPSNWTFEGLIILIAFMLTNTVFFVWSAMALADSPFIIRQNFTIKLISFMSIGSYSVYLFHRPILVFLRLGVNKFISEILHCYILIFVIIPFLFLVGYFIQQTEIKILKRIG